MIGYDNSIVTIQTSAAPPPSIFNIEGQRPALVLPGRLFVSFVLFIRPTPRSSFSSCSPPITRRQISSFDSQNKAII